MRTSTWASTIALSASAVVAQTSEQFFTVQTSIPTAFPSRSTGLVDCNCVQEPCTACTSDGFMSIPPGETPLSSASIVSIITDPLLSSVSGIMSLLPGETPITTGSVDTPPSSSFVVSRPTPHHSSSAGSIVTNSAPPQQTSNAALPVLKDNSLVALAVAGAGAAVAFL